MFIFVFKVRDVRLPRHMKPELYNLQLLPFIIPENFTIDGHLELTMVCQSVGKNVTLHMADMKLGNITYTNLFRSFICSKFRYLFITVIII